MFNNGMGIKYDFENKEFMYGDNSFGPVTEKRKLEDIRQSLKNPLSAGPEIVYSIAMDMGRKKDFDDLVARNLLYGACIYSAGRIGDEVIRSQGHIHWISPSCGYSTPEVYEIWYGEAYIFMQELADTNPGRVFAVLAKAGDVVIVPPGWAHYTANKNVNEAMVFGAWCIRDYGFEYQEVRKLEGLSFFPVIKNHQIEFVKNKKYEKCELTIKKPRKYYEFHLKYDKSIYAQYEEDHQKFDFVTDPIKYKDIWENFIP